MPTWYDGLSPTLKERKCGKCGKVFIPTYRYAYVDIGRRRWYCSWTCFNHRKDKEGDGDERR